MTLNKSILFLYLLLGSCISNKPVKLIQIKLFKGFTFQAGNSGSIYNKIRQMDVNSNYLNKIDTTDIFPTFKTPFLKIENALNHAKRTKYYQFKTSENLYGGFFIDERNIKHYVLFSKVSMIDFNAKIQYWFDVESLLKQ